MLRPGDHALDLGANVGHHTRKIARLIGPHGLVHAFEPNTAHFPSILAIGSNVRLWPFAAGDEFCSVSLHIPKRLDGWASVQDIRSELPDGIFHTLETIKVRVDDLSEINRSKITFANIDVERRELPALIGMKLLVSSARPVIVLENVSREIKVGDDVTGERSPIVNSVAFPKEHASQI